MCRVDCICVFFLYSGNFCYYISDVVRGKSLFLDVVF